ncbi:hypothetical protein PEX1_087460 [Penicillium expansum]|uniref:Transcription factor, fungi n=1 Tax=Penicillium expansum TaxID=27334 RepID=A0A0A2J1D0_PENEN|nr:hypothetical protein PEX2_027460 [Penicillium expansum]KGO42671.1 hypothetical protein PEXP_025420 [Penicillium expansum]KGO46185.1 hypothetical protein PEX1_087460 [Penicillium expansum]KGO50423.1 hypothetical protein PEX2_027460 [Penicillium expansum]
MCHFAAVETIQEITNLRHDNPEIFHTGLSWYATYFLFQATVVLSIHHLRPSQPIDASLVEASEELWISSISRARECLEFLSSRNKSANRCLAVLDRIRDRSRYSQAISTAQSDRETGSLQFEVHSVGPEMHSAPLAIDPTLQMFFNNSAWDNDMFEGLSGFPGTGEVEPFDYLPINNDPGWPRS